MATVYCHRRVYNFSSGPAVLPVPVLEQVQRDLVALPGVGMSVMEISHRSKTFEGVIAKAEADLRALAGIPSNYKVLFLQGGASLQFSMVPMNLLTAGHDGRLHHHRLVGREGGEGSEEGRHRQRRGVDEGRQLQPHPDGVRDCSSRRAPPTCTSPRTTRSRAPQWQSLPDVGDAPLVSDASSDIFSRPIDVSKYGLIYAGAQKNLGPSGRDARDHPRGPAGAVDEVAAHDAELRGARRERLAVQHAAGVRRSTSLGLVLQWLKAQGGLPAIAQVNERKAGKLYAELDRTGFWRPTAEKADRSLMNVTFRLPSEELEKRVREGVDRGRLRRAEGPPIGRRHARVDLQRVPRGGHRRAGRVHARVRADERIATTEHVAEHGAGDVRRCHVARTLIRVSVLDCAPWRNSWRRGRRAAAVGAGRVRDVAGAAGAGPHPRPPAAARSLRETPPVLEHLRRAAVDLEPRQRLVERPAVHQRAARAR